MHSPNVKNISKNSAWWQQDNGHQSGLKVSTFGICLTCATPVPLEGEVLTFRVPGSIP